MKKICIYTSNRSEYSRLKSVMFSIQANPSLELYIIVAGSHLLFRYGLTVKEIEEDGFSIYQKILTVVEGENPEAMGKSAGLAITELTTCLTNLKPDCLLIVGDRYDVLPPVITSAYLNIPVAHIQGGEITGSIDETVRHAITKFSHIHFPATQKAREVIVSMGENPENVYAVGCPSIDLLKQVPAIAAKEIFADLGFKEKDRARLNPLKPFLLAIQHPVTTEYENSYQQIIETLTAIDRLKMQTIMIYPNLDAGSDLIIQGINRFCSQRDVSPFLFFRKHFRFEHFANLIRTTACLVGNSSVGMRESCYYGTPVVNIGTRQKGRDRGSNVVQTGYDANQIEAAVKAQMANGPYPVEEIYGDGKSGARIAEILATIDVSVQKQFYQRV